MNYLQLVLGVVGLLGWLLKKAGTQQLLTAGELSAVAKALTVQIDEVNRASKARQAARDRNASVPAGGVLPDDGFARPDG